MCVCLNSSIFFFFGNVCVCMDFKKCTSIICSNILVIILFFFNFFYLFFFFITRKEHDIKKSLTLQNLFFYEIGRI